MTITSIPENDRKERFIATAGQTIFPFDFPIFAATDLQVKRERAGVESTLILGTDYTLTGAGEQAGGNITLTTGAQLNDIIVLLSAMPSGRTTQYVNGGDLPAAALEADFARLQILLQQILRDARAGLLYPQTDGPMPDLPPIASRAGRFLAFDAQGQPYAAGAPGTALDAVARAGDTMTGPLRIAAGSAAAPGLTPAGDTNSGIFAPAADEIGISLGGQEVARFNSNGLVGRLVPRTWLDVASAATIDLGAQNADSLRVTGTTAISGFGTAPSGTRRRLRFAGVLTITHSAALICPGAANIITAAGDIADVESLGAGNWIVVDYTYVNAANARAAIGAIPSSNFSVLAGSWFGSQDLTLTDANFFDIVLPNNVQSIIGSGYITTNQSGGGAVAGLFEVALLNASLTVVSTHRACTLYSTISALSNSGLQVGFDSIASGNSGWRLRFYGRKSGLQGPFLLEAYEAKIMCVTR